MKKVEKQALPVVLEDGEPVALVFYNPNRDRVIYKLEKADEDEIIKLIENNENPKRA